MKTLLGTIDLVLECRDYRIPLTSRNPLFEQTLEGKERVVVYTHRDLGGDMRDKRVEEVVKKWDGYGNTLFVSNDRRAMGPGTNTRNKEVRNVLNFLKEHAEQRWKLVGHRIMVVGMPNVGKSTLLNALRVLGVGKGKVAGTGAQPGVTRKVGTGVKIIGGEDDYREVEARGGRNRGVGGGVYLLDTPGVFIPYVPDAEAMMKLALCGSVKDTIIPPVMLADYLLYAINLYSSPRVYAEYCEPTNDVVQLLEAVARKTGRLGKGGVADTEATALWIIQRWRQGFLGRFLLDVVDEGAWERTKILEDDGNKVVSLNQARKMERERRRERSRARGAAKVV